MAAKVKNARQIAKYQTGKNLLEFNDKLSPADPEFASQIHSKYSKIHIVALDYSQGTGDKTIIAEVNIDPDTMKFIAEEVLRGVQLDYSEQKILVHKKHPEDESKSRVTIFSVKYNGQMKYPWCVAVENGWGVPETQENGGTALSKGSYQKEKTVRVFISDIEFKKLMIQVRDYIRNFEIINYSALMKKRAEIEAQQKKEKKEE